MVEDGVRCRFPLLLLRSSALCCCCSLLALCWALRTEAETGARLAGPWLRDPAPAPASRRLILSFPTAFDVPSVMAPTERCLAPIFFLRPRVDVNIAD
jgi:hypothetical protein